MAPYSISSLKMTLSRIDVLQDTSASPKLWAITKWSTAYNGGILRPCDGGNSAFTSKTAFPGVTTDASAHPLATASLSTTTANYQNNLPAQYTNPGSPTGYLIVADVVYTYTPGFSFNMWNTNLTSVTTGWTQAFWSRTGLPIDGTSIAAQNITPPGATSSVAVTANLCPLNDPSNA